MKRLALVSAAILTVVAAPVMADAKPRTVAHYGTPVPRPLASGDIIVGVSWFDGSEVQVIDGLVIQMNTQLPVCESTVGPTPPVG